jgi:uncharacterized protein (TIGR03382 family)
VTRRHAVVAVTLLAVAGAAGAWVRETTAVGDPASGLCLWWGSRQVKFKVNTTSAASPPNRTGCSGGYCTPCLDANAAAAAVAAAVLTWNAAAGTDFTFVSDGLSTGTGVGQDSVNLIVFRTGYCFGPNPVAPLGDACRASVGACAAKYNCWEHDASGTIGLTTTTFSTATGEILDADIEFHGWDGNVPANGYYLTCAASPGCSSSWASQPPPASCASTDVASLALHEAGHVLGLDHTCQYAAPYNGCPAGSVMQPVIPSGSTRRTLDPDDVAGISTIYPRGAATLTCGSAPPKSGGGCDTAEGTGALAVLAAVMVGLRTRRRRGRSEQPT